MVATLVVACVGLAHPASAQTEVFDSTNLPSWDSSLGIGSPLWVAYEFSALQDTHVDEIQIYTQRGFSPPESFVNIGTSYGTGAVGSFTLSSIGDGGACGGVPGGCDVLTFAGDAPLQAGTQYWLWIGSTSSANYPLIPWFLGAPRTRPGLALQHTLGTNDISWSDGLTTTSSSINGYPWVRMFSRIIPAAAPPPVVDITVNVTAGYQCNTTLVSGNQGTWATLPVATDCTPPASKPNATLLGWATQASFPVAIAKRQVDNGWGVYETFDSTGQLTGVFIPVGKPTWLSSPGQIYSIWSE